MFLKLISQKKRQKICNIHSLTGFKLLSRFRLSLSHSNERKFNQNFQDYINPLCKCSFETESLSHFFLQLYYFTNIGSALFSELQSVHSNIAKLSDNEIVGLLLYGSPKYD